jgi:hypothetical protein
VGAVKRIVGSQRAADRAHSPRDRAAVRVGQENAQRPELPTQIATLLARNGQSWQLDSSDTDLFWGTAKTNEEISTQDSRHCVGSQRMA